MNLRQIIEKSKRSEQKEKRFVRISGEIFGRGIVYQLFVDRIMDETLEREYKITPDFLLEEYEFVDSLHLLNQLREKPVAGSIWSHNNTGARYEVLMLTNEDSVKPEKFPIMVVYKGPLGRRWSRLLSDWHRSMTEVKNESRD